MAVRVAATLRLADLMAGGAEHVDESAERSGADAGALGRMPRHLACRGLFAERSAGRFTINEVSDLLRSDHPSGMRRWFDLGGFGGRMDLAFTGLMHTVRTGQPAWEAVFGAPFWGYLAADRGRGWCLAAGRCSGGFVAGLVPGGGPVSPKAPSPIA